MNSTVRILLALIIVGSIVAAGLASPAWVAPSAADARAALYLHYGVDYSAVPAWVRIRDLTLKVRVGRAESVEVIAGGRVIPSEYDPASGWVMFTTNATQVDIRIVGLVTQAEQIGEVQKAALRGDKRWAYSLTFDDGRLSVWENGKPLLDRLGYRAGVAIIGEWMLPPGFSLGTCGESITWRGNPDSATTWGYMNTNQVAALLASGWGIYNHGFFHTTPEAMPGCVVENISKCTEALAYTLGGYRTLVYTAYQNREDLRDLAIANYATLGLPIIQAGGGGATAVDNIPWSALPHPLQRWDVGRPRDARPYTSGAIYYMDDAHQKAINNPTLHFWLSLHGHNVERNDVAGSSLDYLHFTYGPGGTDEVWVAPADEVFQYLATRDHAVVTRAPARAVAVMSRPPAIRQVALRQGWNGYTGAQDTYIDSGQPEKNFNTPGESAILRVTSPDRKAGLLKFDVSSIPANARILRATLGFYVLKHSNEGEIDVSAYTLRKAWNPSEATWERASASTPWGANGANSTNGDNRDRDASPTDARSLRRIRYIDVTGEQFLIDDATWYSLDITSAVREWVANPGINFGVVLKGSVGSTEVQIAASEYPVMSLRPCLVITYVEPEAPPAALETPRPEPSPAATATGTPTVTPTPTATSTPTPEPTANPTGTPTPPATPSATPNPPHRLYLPLIGAKHSYSALR
ncbi:MAG: DNRLRE domain-containing protein [Anaerolineae bacterium]|nr:DNRLRE domain-containing protein [Anaerolineae bacterium]